MKKDEQDTSKLVNQHKRLAMGEKITGMKSGGMACKKGGKIDMKKKKGK